MTPPGCSTGTGLVACIAAVALAAPLLAPRDPYASGVDMLTLPSAMHWRTDDLGRDVLSRVIYGARTSFAIGLGAALVAMGIGVPIGLIAGTLRGAIDIVTGGRRSIFLSHTRHCACPHHHRDGRR